MKTIAIVAISVVTSIVAVFGVLFVVGTYEQLEYEKALDEYQTIQEKIYQEELEINKKRELYYRYRDACKIIHPDDFTAFNECVNVRMASSGYKEFKPIMPGFPEHVDSYDEMKDAGKPIDFSKIYESWIRCIDGYYSVNIENHPKDWNNDGVVCKKGLGNSTDFQDNY